MNRRRTGALLVVLAMYVSLSMISVRWVYQRSPLGSWAAGQDDAHRRALQGTEATTNQYRFLVFHVAEGVRVLTGFSTEKTYALLRLVDLIVSVCLFHWYLRKWFSLVFAIAGVLFFFSISPLIYAFHNFHPYDQPNFILHILAFAFIYGKRDLPLIAVAMVGMMVRETFIILPLLYLAYRLTHRERRKVLAFTAVFAALLLLEWGGIRYYFGERQGFDRWQLMANIKFLLSNPVFYPVLLFFNVLLIMSWIRLRKRDRFFKAGLVYSAVFLGIHAVCTVFHEVRCYTPLLLVFVPLALFALRDYVGPDCDMSDDDRTSTKPPARVEHRPPGRV